MLKLASFTAPQNVAAHIHLSHMAERSDLESDLRQRLVDYDLVIPQMLMWEPGLPGVYKKVAKRTISPDAPVARELLRPNGPFAEELAWALYDSDASPSVAFIDFQFDSSSGRAYDAALGRLHQFLNSVVRNRHQRPFEVALAECKYFCTNLNKAQMRRLNHMLKKFPEVIKREQRAFSTSTRLRVLMLVLMEHTDIVTPFTAAAECEPSFTVTVSRQNALESSLLAQSREYAETGEISDLTAARIIGLYFVLNGLMASHDELSASIRFAAEAQVATMDLSALRRLYEK